MIKNYTPVIKRLSNEILARYLYENGKKNMKNLQGIWCSCVIRCCGRKDLLQRIAYVPASAEV
jgi:hypothetical protein